MGDIYGCLQYQFVLDSGSNTKELKATDLHTSWTAYNTWWNPLEKGQYAQTYKLYADTDGRLFERKLLDNLSAYSYIAATDSSTYFVEYGCKQSALGFWTQEYVGIFTKDGAAISSGTLSTIKSDLSAKMPHTDLSKLTVAKKAGECSYKKVWGIF